jgi:hypothetical protein
MAVRVKAFLTLNVLALVQDPLKPKKVKLNIDNYRNYKVHRLECITKK